MYISKIRKLYSESVHRSSHSVNSGALAAAARAAPGAAEEDGEHADGADDGHRDAADHHAGVEGGQEVAGHEGGGGAGYGRGLVPLEGGANGELDAVFDQRTGDRAGRALLGEGDEADGVLVGVVEGREALGHGHAQGVGRDEDFVGDVEVGDGDGHVVRQVELVDLHVFGGVVDGPAHHGDRGEDGPHDDEVHDLEPELFAAFSSRHK